MPRERLLFLAGSVPVGVAAVAIAPASIGDSTAFALSLAAARIVLAAAHVMTGQGREALRRRIVQALLGSAALFTISIWVPEPWRYVLWGIAIGGESSALLHEDRTAARELVRPRDLHALRPVDADEALDPHHFAERFGLFVIILLGEVVVEAGQAAIDGHVATFDGWAALVAAMIFAAALWWLYFDAAADINLRVLEASGGSPTMARAIFAVGHMLPCFALLLIAAGIGLLLEEDPPAIAYTLASVGLGIYLLGTRVFLAPGNRVGGAVRVLLLVATFALHRLGRRVCRAGRGRGAVLPGPRLRRARGGGHGTITRRIGARRMSECRTSRSRARYARAPPTEDRREDRIRGRGAVAGARPHTAQRAAATRHRS